MDRSVVVHFEADEIDNAVGHLCCIDGSLAEHQPGEHEHSNALGCWFDRKVIESLDARD